MRHPWLIAASVIAAGLLAVGLYGFVLWLRVPSRPAYTAKQFAFITAHMSDPRVQPCFAHLGHTVTVVQHETTVISASGYVKELPPGSSAAFLRCMRTRLHGH